ncbi:hypothetical protein B0H11DRAFT_2362533, partial [Mycena galericulata]
FIAYSTPDPSAPYSATYFTGLTFTEASTLVFPTIYESESISAWTFTDETPADHESRVEPGEGVPNIKDLIPILREMEHAFSDGARSVAVTLRVAGKYIDALYHFSKLRLFTHINNNENAVQSASALVSHLASIPLVSPAILDHFLGLPIRSPIFGFCVTDFPLWKLSCLLGEEWLHDDVLNALGELLYFSQATRSPSGTPSTLILPT